MSKFLATLCSDCGEPVEAARVGQLSSAKLGEAIKEAARDGRKVELQAQVELGRCNCESRLTEERPEASGKESDAPRRIWTIRQLLFLTAVASVLLAVFRNPIAMLFGVQKHALVFSPWYLYGWLFFGMEMPAIQKGPPSGVELFLFCTNMFFAVVVGFYVFYYSCVAIRYGWQKVSQR